ncbi:MAG: chemotaxis protein CheD [Proteobacteria bacterium]|nr:chemotaxis protein CheD [Pseudomonadota bacterium]MBU1717069.1 chemotaxis protein CheD [Pseudomonadota bacterium]
MANLVVGVGDFAVSNDPEDIIKTFALGSCVAIIFLHKTSRTVGMVHVALPESRIKPEKAVTMPGYFADTGIPAILKAMNAKGCVTGGNNMIIKLAGGASVMDTNNTFNIGKRNILSIKKILWSLGMGPTTEDLGGTFSRTVTVPVKTGKITLSCPGKKDWPL